MGVLLVSGCLGCGDSPGGGSGSRDKPGSQPHGQGQTPTATGPNVSSPNANLPTAGEEAACAQQRERMVAQLSSPAIELPITDKPVLEAMRAVPRHEFVSPELKSRSYDNNPLPIAEDQTISQPYIVALMTQLLELKGGEKVLEIGTGSGYQAAILGEIAAEVHTVEIRPQLLDGAKRTLESLKSKGVLHYKKLEAHLGDGNKGYPPAAPYDAIVVTAAPRTIPVELLNQLRPGGRLVIPVGDFVQELQLIRKATDGTYTEESIVPVRFVRMDGK